MALQNATVTVIDTVAKIPKSTRTDTGAIIQSPSTTATAPT
jgi:hypothetical protein